MSQPRERKQILDMLAAGKISPEEAQRLLERLDGLAGSEEGSTDTGSARPDPDVPGGTGAPPHGKAKGLPQYLRVLVNSEDGDTVNIRVPFQLIRAGLKLSTVLPSSAREKMQEHGVDLSDLSELGSEEMFDALRELSVDVDSGDGDTVRIFCE